MTTNSTGRRRASLALATALALIAAMFTLASPATAANLGTIKVLTDSACPPNSNQPKVTNPYWFAGFGFQANVAFSLTVETQPGNTPLPPALTGTTNTAGDFCVAAMETPEGQYKVTYTGPDGTKSKVYKVAGDEAPVPIQPVEPEFLDPTCEFPQRAEVVLDTTIENITYEVTGDVVPGGTVVVTATVSEGYVLAGYPEGGWTHTFLPTPECVVPPVPVEVSVPTFADASCDVPNATAMKIPADTDQIDYTAKPSTATPGVTVKVTADPIGNVVLTGYPEGGWSHPFPTIESLNCPPPAAVPAAVTPPTFTNASCTAPASMTIPADTTQIDYTTVGTATPGTSVTVTAKAIGNVVLTGYPATGWSFTFAAAPTNCDAAVGGTQDTDIPTDETDTETAEVDQVVAAGEDELAKTGGNAGPAGLGLLLILSGAALVTARRLALK